MDADGFIDMDSEETKFCVSDVSRRMASLSLEEVVKSWNWHPIPGITIHLYQHSNRYKSA